MDRKEFLAALTALAAVGCTAGRDSDAPAAAAQPTRLQFPERLLDDAARTLAVAMAFAGERLGLFSALAEAGPQTSDTLAASASLHPRLVREWLNGMVAAGYITYAPETQRYELPREQAAAMTDESSPSFSAGLVHLTIPLVLAIRPVMESFRTQRPLTPAVYDEDLWRGIERYSTPAYRHRLVQEWLPAVPACVDKLKSGARIADVGCGAGRALIAMAQAFPRSRFFGFDLFAPTIERARDNAAAAAVADRIEFRVGGARQLPARAFEIVTTFDVVHHYADPVGELTAVRRALTGDGTYLVFDAALGERPDLNVGAWGTFIHGCSVLYCLHDSLAGNGAGLGADFAEPRVRELAMQAGFQRFRRVALTDPTVALYEIED